jgi:hypothetical protein
MSFAKELASAKTSGGGNFIKDGRGKLIVKSAAIVSGHKDKKTFIVEAYVKESASTMTDRDGKPVPPNAPGSTVSYVQLLSTYDSAKGNAKMACLAILGPDSAAKDEDGLAADISELLNLDDKGYTRKGVACIARGVEIAYETRRQWTKDGKTELTLPTFTHVEVTPEEIQANRKTLDTVG